MDINKIREQAQVTNELPSKLLELCDAYEELKQDRDWHRNQVGRLRIVLLVARDRLADLSKSVTEIDMACSKTSPPVEAKPETFPDLDDLFDMWRIDVEPKNGKVSLRWYKDRCGYYVQGIPINILRCGDARAPGSEYAELLWTDGEITHKPTVPVALIRAAVRKFDEAP
jgi:hypothetical protein